jgi:hypothetical protein
MNRNIPDWAADEVAAILDTLLADEHNDMGVIDTTSGGGASPAGVAEIHARWRVLHDLLRGKRVPLWQTNATYADITMNGRLELDPPADPDGEHEDYLAAAQAASRAIFHAWRAGTITTEELAGEVMRLIADDQASGQVPQRITGWADLHTHVDANTYGLEVLGMHSPSGADPLWKVEELCDRWLREAAQG